MPAPRTNLCLLPLVGVIAVGLLLVFLAWVTRDDIRTVSIPRGRRGWFGDEEALIVSRAAMTRTRKESRDYVPVRYDRTNYFARNMYNTNNGYVLWQNTLKSLVTVSVEMDVEGDTVICHVIRNK